MPAKLKIPANPVGAVYIPSVQRTANIFLLKPGLTFVAIVDEFRGFGSSKDEAIEDLKTKLDVPLLDWRPVISYSLEFGSSAIRLDLERKYVACTSKKGRCWAEAPFMAIVEGPLVLDDKSQRVSDNLELPDTLADDQRRKLFTNSRSAGNIINYEGHNFVVSGAHQGYMPYDKVLWSKLLMLEDCIRLAGEEMLKLLATADGHARLMTSDSPLTLKL